MRMRKRAHFDNVTLYKNVQWSFASFSSNLCKNLLLHWNVCRLNPALVWYWCFFDWSQSLFWVYTGHCRNISFFKKKFGGYQSFLWGHWFPCFVLLMMSALDFKARVDFLAGMICHLHAIDSPLVWHMPNSWQLAWQLNHSYPHICVTSASFVLVRMFFLII